MSPQDNSDAALSVYADWLEDSGYPDQSEEVRDGILAERTTSSALYLPTNGDGWCIGFGWSRTIGDVGAGYGAGYAYVAGGVDNSNKDAVGVEYPRNNNFVW